MSMTNNSTIQASASFCSNSPYRFLFSLNQENYCQIFQLQPHHISYNEIIAKYFFQRKLLNISATTTPIITLVTTKIHGQITNKTNVSHDLIYDDATPHTLVHDTWRGVTGGVCCRVVPQRIQVSTWRTPRRKIWSLPRRPARAPHVSVRF